MAYGLKLWVGGVAACGVVGDWCIVEVRISCGFVPDAGEGNSEVLIPVEMAAAEGLRVDEGA
jgi:hypothetical protein